MSGLLALISGKDPVEAVGGDLDYVRAHARAAVRAGYAPEILCVGVTARTQETDFGVIRRIASPFRPLRQLMIPGHGPLLARAFVSLARERQGPVLAHGFGVWGYAAVRGCARLRAEGRSAVPVISSYTTYRAEQEAQVRGLAGDPVRAVFRFRAQALWSAAVVERYERAAHRGAERVFVNYDSVRRLIHAHHGAAVRVSRLAYGPESDFLAPAPPPPPPATIEGLEPATARLVLSISTHHPRKGVDVLIAALALARDRGARFRACLLGRGPLLEEHRRRVSELGLADSVIVPGHVPETEPYLGAADIFVLPSRAEQSGSLALLEALRAGVPAIAAAVDGIPEDVVDGESALLVPPEDPSALAAALVRLSQDADLREQLVAGGRQTFAERFTAERFTAALADAYAELGFEP